MYKKQLISVIIPCYNEAKGLQIIFQKIPRFVDEVVVVDNQSTDNTYKIAKDLGAQVVKENKKGYGSALKKGLDLAQGDILVTIDGDGTYPIEESPQAIDYLLAKKLDFISCSRFPLTNGKSMYWQNYFGNKLVTWLMSRLFNFPFTDGLSGMWIFRKKLYPKLLPLSPGWNISEEIKIKAILNNLKFAEYHINYYGRVGKSKVWPLKVGIENIIYLLQMKFFRNKL